MHACKKNGLKNVVLQQLERSYTDGEISLQSCKGATENKPNSSIQTALCCNSLNMYTAAHKRE